MNAPVPRARFIPDLLQLHAQELAFLWGQRRAALQSQRHTLREYGELNERIEAHVQGLLVADTPSLLALVQPALAGDERDETFSAAYALLRLGDAQATRAVVAEFARAIGPALAGLRDALSLAPHVLFADELRSALENAEPATAAAAAVALANHGLLNAASLRLSALLSDADPAMCEMAWRAAAHADIAAKGSAPTRPFKAALTHAAPAVRHAGWYAAAWSGQAAALPALRQVAAGADAVALHWLAVLGDESDLALLQQAAPKLAPVAARCAVLARHGHPASLEILIDWMDPADPALAAEAGAAFTRITGVELHDRRDTLPVPDDADEFEREMAPEVWLPDPTRARTLLQRRGAEWSAATRLCRGLRLDGEVSRDTLTQLDLQARWETAARAAFSGRRLSTPAPIH